MIVATPLCELAIISAELADGLATMGGGFRFEPDRPKGCVKCIAEGWAAVDTIGGAVISPVDVYAGRVTDNREFWKLHNGFLPYGAAEPVVTTTADLVRKEEAARLADSQADREDFMAWAMGRRLYGAHTVRRS